MAKKGLGRGLDALLSDNAIEPVPASEVSGAVTIRVSDIEPNKEQARKKFDKNALAELAASISLHGLVQPIAVRKKENGYYEIIAGERRWRACKMAGISEIQAIILDVKDGEAAELSLIENLQRENLNPVEEARGYKNLMTIYDLTQEEAAEKVGKSRAAVANIIRILKLPASVLTFVEDGALSYGHARTLLPLTDILPDDKIKEIAESVIKSDLSVRETEKFVRKIITEAENPPETGNNTDKAGKVEKNYYKHLEKTISESIGRNATIKTGNNGTGTVTIAYSNTEDFETLIKQLCGDDFFAAERK